MEILEPSSGALPCRFSSNILYLHLGVDIVSARCPVSHTLSQHCPRGRPLHLSDAFCNGRTRRIRCPVSVRGPDSRRGSALVTIDTDSEMGGYWLCCSVSRRQPALADSRHGKNLPFLLFSCRIVWIASVSPRAHRSDGPIRRAVFDCVGLLFVQLDDSAES